MTRIPNLLIVGGTGSKSGKTTIACRLIEQFRDQGVISIKISPHYHEKNDGLMELLSGEGYTVYRETDPGSGKDTSRMLKAGAAKVFLALVWDSSLPEVFQKIMETIPADTPVICESPSLRSCFEPGVFIIMSSNNENKYNNINYLENLPHLKFNMEELVGLKEIPVEFKNGRWIV